MLFIEVLQQICICIKNKILAVAIILFYQYTDENDIFCSHFQNETYAETIPKSIVIVGVEEQDSGME